MNVLKYLLAGVGTAIVGLFFAELWSELLNGFGKETSYLMGMLVYLCIVVVTCTGLLLNKREKEQTAPEK